MNKNVLLQKYLDKELSPEEEKKALHIIADDDELRSELHFELFLRKSINQPEFSSTSFEVPGNFTDNVMSKIKHHVTESDQELSESFTDKITDWLYDLFTPRYYQLKPAFAISIFLLLLVLPVLPFYLAQTEDTSSTINNQDFQAQTVSERNDQVMVRFIYVDDNAENIAIAGDFNNWNPVSLSRQEINGQDVWTGFVNMSRGEHKYMFIVNGEDWVTDPLAGMYEDDGFGNKNALLYL